MDTCSIEELLSEQRLMVQRCLDNALQCLAFNETISKKIAQEKFGNVVEAVTIQVRERANWDRPRESKCNEALTKKVAQEQLGGPAEKESILDGERAHEAGRQESKSKSTDLKEPLLRSNLVDTQGNECEKRKASAQAHPLFAQRGSVRDRVLNALKEPVYNVEDFYKEEGCAQAVAKSEHFMHVTFAMIALNTVWMSIETDYNKAIVLSEAPLIFQMIDNIFTIFFFSEILVRFCAFRRKKDAFRDSWFVFDAILVLFMLWETYIIVIVFMMLSNRFGGTRGMKQMAIFRLFRLLRLTRIARLARVLRAIPELMVLAKAMVMALRSLGATMMLLVLVIYVFSIIFTQLFSDSELGKGYFENMPQTFNTLLMAGVFTDPQPYMLHMLEGSVFYYLLIIFFILVSTFTVLNMLVGVICQVISEVADREREEIVIHDLRYKIGKISSHFKQEHDTPDDHEPTVSRDDVLDLLNHDEATKVLNQIGVDVVSLVDLVDFIFPDDENLDLSKFLQTVLQFRGSNNATVKDVVDMRKFISHQMSALARKKTEAPIAIAEATDQTDAATASAERAEAAASLGTRIQSAARRIQAQAAIKAAPIVAIGRMGLPPPTSSLLH